MQVFYSESDMISFGLYLLSEKREKRIKENESDISYEDRYRDVYDADFENWLTEEAETED